MFSRKTSSPSWIEGIALPQGPRPTSGIKEHSLGTIGMTHGWWTYVHTCGGGFFSADVGRGVVKSTLIPIG